ncbi:MAG: MBL fold metallo-hydrolase [Verrucomicrobiia bacterium]|jgi:hydroxyacylglutathione hydrolase
MSLEDHIGDIIFKARRAVGISEAAVAEVGDLTASQLAEFEEYGRLDDAPDLEAIAALLGLNAVKLNRLADGWEPDKVDLNRWRSLEMITTEEGMAVNCFLVWDEATRAAALFDTGWDATPIWDLVDRHELDLQHLFITHSHGDHIAAIGDVRKRFPEIRLHSDIASAPKEQRVNSSEIVNVGKLAVSNRDTPGHADDGVTFIVEGFPGEAPAVAVVGDVIFAGSMGGHDRAPELARQKAKDQILSLPPDTLVCPGHGPLCTVKEANDTIPFF